MTHYNYQRKFLLAMLRALRKTPPSGPVLDLIAEYRMELAALRHNSAVTAS